MKKLIAVLLCAALITSLVSCALAEDPTMVGTWQVRQDGVVTEEAQAALEKALEGLTGANYEPLLLLGTQVVAGINYCLLCRITPLVPDAASHYALVYVYDGVNGSAELLSVVDIDIPQMLTDSRTEK